MKHALGLVGVSRLVDACKIKAEDAILCIGQDGTGM